MKNWNLAAALVCVLTLGAARADEKPKVVTLPEGMDLLSLEPEQTAGLELIKPGSRVDLVYKTAKLKITVMLEDLTVFSVDTLGNGTVRYSVGVTMPHAVIMDALAREGAKPTLTLRPPPKKK